MYSLWVSPAKRYILSCIPCLRRHVHSLANCCGRYSRWRSAVQRETFRLHPFPPHNHDLSLFHRSSPFTFPYYRIPCPAPLLLHPLSLPLISRRCRPTSWAPYPISTPIFIPAQSLFCFDDCGPLDLRRRHSLTSLLADSPIPRRPPWRRSSPVRTSSCRPSRSRAPSRRGTGACPSRTASTLPPPARPSRADPTGGPPS
jgi:hypothetical protein